jgi:hypothetical protein
VYVHHDYNYQGICWCIFKLHISPNSPIVSEVVRVPEKEYQRYVLAVQ